jgi:hypothetical protein
MFKFEIFILSFLKDFKVLSRLIQKSLKSYFFWERLVLKSFFLLAGQFFFVGKPIQTAAQDIFHFCNPKPSSKNKRCIWFPHVLDTGLMEEIDLRTCKIA